MSFGKSSNNSKSSTNATTNQTQTGTQTQSTSETPNNLGFLQQGWDAISKLFDQTNGNSAANVNNGIDLTTQAGANGAAASAGGLEAIQKLVSSGALNPANANLTPFANGSMTGPNPLFDQVVGQISQAAQKATDGGMAASGRYGSGANANAFNGAVTNTAGQLGYQNYNDSVNRQLDAAKSLSTNNTNSTNQMLAALGLIPSVSGAGTDAGAAVAAAGAAPSNTFANLLALLGGGGSTANSTGTASGTVNGTQSGNSTGSSTSTNMGLSVKFPFGALNFG